MSKDRYESPLASRYASKYMLHLFSAEMRIQTWRRLWVALARAEHNLGLPVSAEQVAELVSSKMESVAFMSVPLTAEAKWGKSWFEAK